MISFGKSLKYLRLQKGLSQSALAHRMQIGRRYLTELENDRGNPSLKILEKIAYGLEMPLSAVMQFSENIRGEFKSLEDLKHRLVDMGLEDTTVLESPSYISSVIGISENGQVIYDFEQMVVELMKEGMNYDEAVDFIEYNTISALPYMGDQRPVILYPL